MQIRAVAVVAASSSLAYYTLVYRLNWRRLSVCRSRAFSSESAKPKGAGRVKIRRECLEVVWVGR